MRARHADRLWMIAGAAVVVLLTAVTWLLLVSPQLTEADSFRGQAETTRAQAGPLRARNAELAADQTRLRQLTARYDALAAALPKDSGVPAFLRELQTSGTKVGVDVSGITVGKPVAEKGPAGVWSLPIQLTADGTAAQLSAFLERLQGTGQQRAVLVEAANMSSGGGDVTGAGRPMSLTLTVKAFVAPPAGAGAPAVTTD